MSRRMNLGKAGIMALRLAMPDDVAQLIPQAEQGSANDEYA